MLSAKDSAIVFIPDANYPSVRRNRAGIASRVQVEATFEATLKTACRILGDV
jgi:hypothetical protein